MTIQMREGWALCRGGVARRYVYDRSHFFGETHPWRPVGGNMFQSVTNGGERGTKPGLLLDDDVVELLDPWDARVPEEHRETRFVVGTYLPKGGHAEPCVFDRQKLVGAGFPAEYFGSEIERVTAECNAAFDSGREVGLSWSPKHMFTIDGKSCNPDGSPIAEQQEPESPKVEVVEVAEVPKAEPFVVAAPPLKVTRTLRSDGWQVHARRDGDSDARVYFTHVDLSGNDDGLSTEAARVYAAAILAVCEEIEQ